MNYSRWPKSSRDWWRKRPVYRQAPGFGFVWGQGGSLLQNSRMPVTLIPRVHHIHWLWVFATLKWQVLILRQPNGAVILRRPWGMPTADTKKRSVRLWSLSKHWASLPWSISRWAGDSWMLWCWWMWDLGINMWQKNNKHKNYFWTTITFID